MNPEIEQEISEIENASEFNTLINIRELEQNHRYPIMGIKKVKTKFGEKVVVDLGGHDVSIFSFCIYLTRFVPFCFKQLNLYFFFLTFFRYSFQHDTTSYLKKPFNLFIRRQQHFVLFTKAPLDDQ